ncbi:MAG: lipid II flippase MurJ, partial [Candidatus Gracilibacteria bacterium]|nr:lipid II flippase MurJ [Candidatus Gracilibacteria bacterium]
AAVGLAFLAAPIVKIILQTGEFTAQDTKLTSAALIFFAISIPIESLVHLFARLFYAHKKVWTPVLISITAVALNLILSYQLALRLDWGAAGMALSFTIYTSFQLVSLLIFTQLKLLKLPYRQLVQKLLKVCVASLLMYGTLVLGESLLSSETFLLKTFILIVSGAFSYLLSAFILKCEELAIIKKLSRL